MANVFIRRYQQLYKYDEDEYFGMENKGLETLMAPIRDARQVFLYQRKPRKIAIIHIRNYMRLMGILPRFWKGESVVYKMFYVFIVVLFAISAVSITCDLKDAYKDVLMFGEDLVVLIGIYLIFFKLLLFAYHTRDIEDIMREFCKMYAHFAYLRKSPNLLKMRKLQRIFFLAEVLSFYLYVLLSFFFSAAICLPPILMGNNGTPYRAKFPFEWQDQKQHPILYSSVYIFQSLFTVFILLTIVLIDNIGCQIFTETTLNLKLFCIRVRELGSLPGENRLEELHKAIKFHQYMINLISRINNIYYYNYVAQMAASTFMICLTAFEAMLAEDQPMVAIKFQMYMFSAFAQIFYWCFTGNMVYYNSLDVADAAYEINRWYEQSSEFKYCLRFFIRRAQKPLAFRPKPFFCFNFESFTSILSTSYSYFALLRTMND